MGIWKDEHIDFLARITRFLHRRARWPASSWRTPDARRACGVPGKAAVDREAEGGWQTVAPSAIPFRETDPAPHALSKREIQALVEPSAPPRERALQAGFDVVEIHGAHGYLIHEILFAAQQSAHG